MSRRAISRLKLFLLFVVLTTAFGALDGYFLAIENPEEDSDLLLQISFSWCVGSIMFWGFEILYVPSRRGEAFRRMHFAAAIFLKTVILVSVVVVAGMIGDLVFLGSVSLDVMLDPNRQFVRTVLIVTFLVLVLQIALQVVRIVGARNFVNFALGRYVRPVPEERIFMFLDIAGSTTLAERLGDVGVQRLITRFFFDLSEPIAEYGGEIHQYVGDEMVVTWPLRDGKSNLRVLSCCFAIAERVREGAADYERDFGVVPGYRIGLHGGSIVISQCGDQKQEISYYGDTINTAARIVQECKPFGRSLLLSSELLHRIDLPSKLRAIPVGTVQLRGRATSTDLFGIDPA